MEWKTMLLEAMGFGLFIFGIGMLTLTIFLLLPI